MQLELNNICKSYGKITALKDFSASFSSGIYAILGPNGSGKSTLINILTCNLRADSGHITYSNGCVLPENIEKMGVRYREMLGYMPQYPSLYPSFSVESFMWYMAT